MEKREEDDQKKVNREEDEQEKVKMEEDEQENVKVKVNKLILGHSIFSWMDRIEESGESEWKGIQGWSYGHFDLLKCLIYCLCGAC